MARRSETQVIERGDLAFFYRPKVRVKEVRGLDDVQRFYMLLAAEGGARFRLLVIGQKELPEIAPGEARPSERDWAIVDAVTDDPRQVGQWLGWEKTAAGTPIYPARPAGAGTYEIVRHEDHTELACKLAAPARPGPVQEAFHIHPEASYILKVRDPRKARRGFPGARQKAEYPPELLELFDQDWSDLVDTRLLDYENAQVLLIGAHRAQVEEALDIDLRTESADRAVRKLYRTLRMSEREHPEEPLVEGEWPERVEAA